MKIDLKAEKYINSVFKWQHFQSFSLAKVLATKSTVNILSL